MRGPGSEGRSTEPADVVAIYRIVLGRNPESDMAIATYRGMGLDDVVAEILRSAEISQLVANALADGVVPHTGHLSASDFAEAASWLANEIDDFTLEASASWWLLVDRFVNALWRGKIGRDVEASLAEYAILAALRADEDLAAIARMQSSMVFNPNWFRRAYARSLAAFPTDQEESPARFFLSIGRHRGDQLLAAFSENLSQVYAAVPDERRSSLDAYVEVLIEAAGRGETGHWLFATDFHRDVRIRLSRANGHVAAISGTYLQFLLDGDRERWAPHPLFSHFTYRKLNALPDGRVTFEDYLIRGMFEGARTSSLFDPDYYLELNPSAQLALLNGTHHCALHHFLTVGIHRDYSFSPDFNIAYYREIYPDVAADVLAGNIPSASWHFLHRGLLEGRRPNRFFDPHYYVQRHPYVIAEMAGLGINSELEHFLLVGRERGLKAEPPLAERAPSLDEAKVVFHRRALRSFDRQWRAPFDFRTFETKDPALSVIVPVHNEVHFTALFLESAFFAAAHMFHAGIGGFEVIVVDNGSTEQTARLVEKSRGVRSLHFPDPIGYPLAVKAGLGVARGKVVIVANNDVSFLPDAFALAVEALEADASIGVIGPLVMLPNETLQEAGSFVDRNGGVVSQGRFENPWDAYFRRVAEADYCAGCFFALRREDFTMAGGVDEDFSPGYYEEADLNFRIREQLGKRAVVLPDLQIIHFEHASFGKGRPPSAAFAVIQRNQRLFAAKHGEALLSRPTPSALAPRGRASAIATGRRRMLVIADAIPRFGDDNDGARRIELLRRLEASGFAFEILALHPDPDVEDFEDPRIMIKRGWMPGENLTDVLADADRRFSHVLVFGAELLGRFSAVLEPIRQATGLRIICDTGEFQAPDSLRDEKTGQDKMDGVRLALRNTSLVSPWIASSERDRTLIEEAGLGTAVVFTLDTPVANTSADWQTRVHVLMLGGGPHCVLGASWLATELDPDQLATIRQNPILLSGGWRTRSALLTHKEPLGIATEVVDASGANALQALYDRCRIVIAPPLLRTVADILQAMTHGVPVILSSLHAVALTAKKYSLSGLAVIDDQASLADWFGRLTENPEAWAELQAAQFRLLKARLDREGSHGGIDRLVALL